MIQIILGGLATGSIYGLVAMGFSISFYVTRVINFAQGQLMMAAIMIVSTGYMSGWPIWLAIVAGVSCSCVLAVVTYMIAVRPVVMSAKFNFGWLVTTLGFAIVLENGAALIWGTTSRPFPSLLNDISVSIGPANLTLQQLVSIVVASVLTIAFEIVRKRTLFGKLGMAIASDPEMASLMGANITLFAFGAFLIAGFYTGVAGILIGPQTFANPYLGGTYSVYGFVAMMIGGGTERPVPAMFGGLLLGITVRGSEALIGSQASDWFPFVLLVVVLILSPEGLFSSDNVLFQVIKRFKKVGDA